MEFRKARGSSEMESELDWDDIERQGADSAVKNSYEQRPDT